MPKRRRLLILESLPTISGGQQALLKMLPALSDYDLHALLPGSGILAEALTACGVTCHFTPMVNYALLRKGAADLLSFPFDQLRLAFHCVRLVRRLRVDLIYANSSRTFTWGTLAGILTHTPILWHLHNLLADRKTLFLVRQLGRSQAVCQIVAVSGGAADQLPALRHKMVVVPVGVDTSSFRPDAKARTRVRAEFGIPPDRFIVGMVGDLIPLKGQHTLLEAVDRGLVEAHYLIAGDVRPGDAGSSTYATRLREMAGDNVIFVGRREDLPAVINGLDLLVVASERETGPLVLLEALACGVPAISTPVGRATELLPPENLFPIGDSVALVDRLRFWLADRQRLEAAGRAARTLAEERLAVELFRARMRAEIERKL